MLTVMIIVYGGLRQEIFLLSFCIEVWYDTDISFSYE